MAKIYAVINQKGGVGKSTTAAALAAGLTQRGYKTLSVDLDAQGNLSYMARADTGRETVLELLTGGADITQVLQTAADGGDIVSASRLLAGADLILKDTGKEYRLKEALDPVAGNYDYIVIDTPPALGILTVNALTAADGVIIPAQADIFSLQGIGQLSETIAPVKKYCNPSLKITGILLTRFSPRAVLSKEILSLAGKMAGNLGTKVFNATIREGIAIKEAQATQQPIFTYAPKAKVAEDYTAFINELLKGELDHGKEI